MVDVVVTVDATYELQMVVVWRTCRKQSSEAHAARLSNGRGPRASTFPKNRKVKTVETRMVE
jgi:hypothetical protein